MSSQIDVDYAAGYYDGVQGMPVCGSSVPYLQGHEDGTADRSGLSWWSEQLSIMVTQAYNAWAEIKDEA